MNEPPGIHSRGLRPKPTQPDWKLMKSIPNTADMASYAQAFSTGTKRYRIIAYRDSVAVPGYHRGFLVGDFWTRRAAVRTARFISDAAPRYDVILFKIALFAPRAEEVSYR